MCSGICIYIFAGVKEIYIYLQIHIYIYIYIYLYIHLHYIHALCISTTPSICRGKKKRQKYLEAVGKGRFLRLRMQREGTRWIGVIFWSGVRLVGAWVSQELFEFPAWSWKIHMLWCSFTPHLYNFFKLSGTQSQTKVDLVRCRLNLVQIIDFFWIQ